MPDIREMLRILEIFAKREPIHPYALGSFVGRPTETSALAWKWLRYFEALGIIDEVRSLADPRGKRLFVLPERGKRLLFVMEEVWGDEEKFSTCLMFILRSMYESKPEKEPKQVPSINIDNQYSSTVDIYFPALGAFPLK